NDPGTPPLANAVEQLAEQQANLTAWGGWDPFLDPLIKLHESEVPDESTPVIRFLVTQKSRHALRGYLANSRSQGVRAVLALREVRDTGRFVPATQPGGQPLDAVILLTALLYQGEHLSPELQREVRGLAESATATGRLGDFEEFALDL